MGTRWRVRRSSDNWRLPTPGIGLHLSLDPGGESPPDEVQLRVHARPVGVAGELGADVAQDRVQWSPVGVVVPLRGGVGGDEASVLEHYPSSGFTSSRSTTGSTTSTSNHSRNIFHVLILGHAARSSFHE